MYLSFNIYIIHDRNAASLFLLSTSVYSLTLVERGKSPSKRAKYTQALSSSLPVRFHHVTLASTQTPRWLFLPLFTHSMQYWKNDGTFENESYNNRTNNNITTMRRCTDIYAWTSKYHFLFVYIH